MLSATQLQADLAVLRLAYETLHPGLYRYSSKEEMDAKFEALSTELNHEQTLREAYLAFSVFAAQVRCGHTYANFFNQPKQIANELFKGQNRLPFYFDWVDGDMVVTKDFTPNHDLPRGTLVLAVNGVSTSAIRTKLMTVARADGANDAKRLSSLQVNGDSLYETFDVFYPLFFPQETTAITLTFRRPSGSRPQVKTETALTFDQRIAPIKDREAQRKGGDSVLFEWTRLKDGSAYLKMPTWALFDSKWDWKSWLNAHLNEIAQDRTPALIIDLRGNEGGQDVGNIILSHLVSEPVSLPSVRRLVRRRKIPDELDKYLDTWDPSFKDWGKDAVDLPQPWPTAPPVEYLLLTKYDDDATGNKIVPEGRHFEGKVFVLVDASNSSATFQFDQIVQQEKLGVLVGQPTGGSQRGINGGAFFFVRLPNSKIELDLPLVGAFPVSAMPDAGLLPDVSVRPTRKDIISGKDSTLMAASRLAGARQ